MSKGKQQEALVRYWLSRAEESLASARSELEAGRLAFAVNRMYYAVFYSVTAALANQGEKLGKHSAVRASFHKNFVRTGVVDKAYGRLYDELYHARHQGDYIPMTEFEEMVVRQQLADTEEFVKKFSREILQS